MASSALEYPATARNRDPILAVLRDHLPASGRVLEIAGGSGEHAVYMAARLSGLVWLPTDPDPRALASIEAWRAEAGLSNLLPPLALDVRDPAAWPDERFDAVVCINMVHISPWAATEALMAGAARALGERGVLYLYGPYREAGVPTAPSNEAFDASLKARNPEWGLRDRADVEAEASRSGLILASRVEMPANNLSLIFRKGPAAAS